MRKFLCFLGWHEWKYNINLYMPWAGMSRTCAHCGRFEVGTP